MIWLSDSALRYAADICYEKPNYTVIVFVTNRTATDDIERKLKTFIKNKHATVQAGTLRWHADYENGSTIKIMKADDGARGNRCNLAIVSENISQTEIDNIIRPLEFNQRHDHEPPFPGAEIPQTGGFINQEIPLNWEPLTYAVNGTLGNRVEEMLNRHLYADLANTAMTTTVTADDITNVIDALNQAPVIHYAAEF